VPTSTCFGTKVPSSGSLLTTNDQTHISLFEL